MYLSVVGRDTTVLSVPSDEVKLGVLWMDTHPECQMKPCDMDILGPLNEYLGPWALSFLRTLEVDHTPFSAGASQPQIKLFFAAWFEEGVNHGGIHGVASTDPIYLVGDNGKTVAKAT